jgi:hypothetical protein
MRAGILILTLLDMLARLLLLRSRLGVLLATTFIGFRVLMPVQLGSLTVSCFLPTSKHGT